jgi:hypothetical protein
MCVRLKTALNNFETLGLCDIFTNDPGALYVNINKNPEPTDLDCTV